METKKMRKDKCKRTYNSEYLSDWNNKNNTVYDTWLYIF